MNLDFSDIIDIFNEEIEILSIEKNENKRLEHRFNREKEKLSNKQRDSRRQERKMSKIRNRILALVAVFAISVSAAFAAPAATPAQSASNPRMIERIRKQLVTLPYYGVFDFLAFAVDKGTVRLTGYAYRDSLKNDAAAAVKRAPGVGPKVAERLVIELKRNAVPQVVLNQLYKRTQLQDNFGVNMLALVDGVPRTLSLDAFIRHWVTHQIEVVVRRTRFRLRKAEERAHILRALLRAMDRIDEVISLIRSSASADDARTGLMGLLAIDDIQARAILDMQLRKLAALERNQLTAEYDELMALITDYNDILSSDARQRGIIREELGEIVEKYGDERRTHIIPFEGDMRMEDFIAEEDVVVTISRGGYAKRTRIDNYRAQKRGGKGVRGAQLKQDDIVQHFFVTTTHHWILCFTNQGRVYRTKAYELPEAARDARGQHVANLLPFQPGEEIAQIMALRDYEAAPYLVLATREGLVKKSRLEDFDSARAAGIIAINLREEDELIAARLVFPGDDLLLISSDAQAIRFPASDESLRPMGRATSGVIGMRFLEGDYLLSMDVIRPDDGSTDVLVATENGYAKRTPSEQYPVQNRGGKGVLTAKVVEARGKLVGALMVDPEVDEIFAITSAGGVIRTGAAEVKQSGRTTMGVRLMNLDKGNKIVAVAANAEAAEEAEAEEVADAVEAAEAAAADTVGDQVSGEGNPDA